MPPDDYLSLSREDRRAYCEQAAAVLGLPPMVIEKDYWVCWTLREVFGLTGWREHLLFKGGTSLSKCWGLIKRFSEDIDLVIDRRWLGFSDGHDLSRKQLKKLRKAAVRRIHEQLYPTLQGRIDYLGLHDQLRLTLDPDDPDEQTLLLDYGHGFADTTTYLRPVVKVELGARSDVQPAEERPLRSYLSEALPHALSPEAIPVRALSPRRTFWEKAMLLHEEAFRPPDKPRRKRMARHYYDLWCLISAGIGAEAAADTALFAEVASHRETFFAQSWVDYSTLRRGTLSVLPASDQEPGWRTDFAEMRIYFFPSEHPPTWDEMMDVISAFERDFNAAAP